MIDNGFFRDGICRTPHQPATVFFRAVELGHLVSEQVIPLQGKLMDFGCGDGSVFGLLRERLRAPWAVVGVDRDSAEAEAAVASGVYEAVLTADGEALPFDDCSFDVILCNSVLEHLDRPLAVLRELVRVLKRGGTLVITVPTNQLWQMAGAPGWFARLATGTHDREAYSAAIDRRVAHRFYWSQYEWADKLSALGMPVVHQSSYMSTAELRRWLLLSNATAGLAQRILRTNAHPINIQRRLGIRRASTPLWVRFLGLLIGAIGRMGLSRGGGEDSGQDESRGACLLLSATKT